MNIVGRSVTHVSHPHLGIGVVEALDGDICIVRWKHGKNQFAGLKRHPRSVLSFVPNDGLQEENEWLRERLSHLEEYIRKLEYENFKLKSTIGSAIKSLKIQNAETKEMIYGTNSKGIITTDENFKSYVKKDEES